MKCKLCRKALRRINRKAEAYKRLCHVKCGDWLDEIFHQRCWDKFKIEDKPISSEYPLLDFFKKIEYN